MTRPSPQLGQLAAAWVMLPLLLSAVLGCQDRWRTRDAASDGLLAGVPRMRLERVRAIADHAHPFGQITTVIADDDGNAYLLDGQAASVLVFGSDGRLARTIGRQGAGPGEFAHLSGLAWAGDRLLAMDVTHGRFTLFERTGEVVSTHSTGRRFVQRGAPSMYSGGDRGFARILHPSGTGVDEFDEYLVFDRDGNIFSVPAVPEPPMPPGGMLCSSPDRLQSFGIDLPFADRGPHRAFLPGEEIALAYRDSFVIRILDVRSGEGLREIRIAYPDLPLTDADWERQPEVQRFRELEGEHGTLLHRSENRECPIMEYRPATWPVVRTMVSDVSGRLWIETTAPGGDGHLLLMLDGDGSPIGQARMPQRDVRVPPYVRGNLLYLVSVDDLWIQTLEVFQTDIVR